MSTDDRRTTESGEAVDRAAERLDRRRGSWDRARAGETDRDSPAAATDPTARTEPPARAGRADRLEQLLLHQAASGERPYLDSIPAGYDAESVVFDWLDFLVGRGGYRATVDALRYYRSVGWLTDRAEDQLLEYLRGFPDTATAESLGVEDHEQSLVYVAKLASLR
jgi:archaellum component FlaD/FlaE